MYKKIILITLVLLISTTSVSAQETQESISKSTITPDSPFYGIKLWLEDIQETLTFNEVKKLTLQQEHLQNRMNELRYETLNNYNKNTEKLLQKIQIKQLEIEEILDNIPKCPAIADGWNTRQSCYFNYINTSMKGVLNEDGELTVIKHSQEVLTNLLNNPRMPEQSRKGLENALNKTIKTIKIPIKSEDEVSDDTLYNVMISANMVQGTYTANPVYLSFLPFTNVAVLDPSENKWYSIVIENDKIIILDYLSRDTPQYYLYLTSSQIKSFELTARRINQNGMTTKDKIQLLKLWYGIKKEEVR